MTYLERFSRNRLNKEQIAIITLLDLPIDICYSKLMVEMYQNQESITNDWMFIVYEDKTVGYLKRKLREYGII